MNITEANATARVLRELGTGRAPSVYPADVVSAAVTLDLRQRKALAAGLVLPRSWHAQADKEATR